VPALLSKSPLAMAWLSALLGVGAVALTYRMASEFFGNRAAVWATVLFATSTWAVMFSRKIWAPDLSLFFVTLAMYGALKYAREGRPWGVVLFCFGLGWATQLHFSAVALWLIAPVLLAWPPKKPAGLEREPSSREGAVRRAASRLRPWPLGLAVAVLPAVPYVLYQCAYGWPGLAALAVTCRNSAIAP